MEAGIKNMIIIPAFPEEWSLAFCRPWIRLGHPLEIAGTFQKLFEARRRIHVGDRDGDPGSEVIRVPPTHSYNAGKAGLRWMDECVCGEQSYARAHAHAYPHTPTHTPTHSHTGSWSKQTNHAQEGWSPCSLRLAGDNVFHGNMLRAFPAKKA